MNLVFQYCVLPCCCVCHTQTRALACFSKYVRALADISLCIMSTTKCCCERGRAYLDIMKFYMLTRTSTCSMVQPLPANVQERNCAKKHTVLPQVLASYCFIRSWFFQATGEDFVLWPSPRVRMAPGSRNKLPMKRALESG